MSCARFREDIGAYVDGALTAREQEALSLHLAVCSDCAGLVASEGRLNRMLGAVRDVEPSPTFERDFARALRLEAAREADEKRRPAFFVRLLSGWRALAVGGAAAAAAVALTIALWPREGPTSAGPGGQGPGAAGIAKASDAPPRGLLQKLELLRNLEVAQHLEVLEGVTPEELEAVAELPELGG